MQYKINNNKLICNHCNEELGTLIDVNGETWVRFKTIESRHLRGRCKNCKRLFSFDSNDMRLKRLIERIQYATIDEIK